MTSRYGKTYSRKGGNSNSKFDEVFSGKRAKISTKWGETTFKAQVGQKRPNLKPEPVEPPKRQKVEEELSEDPFGFDSDDESLPVSSRNITPSKGQQSVETLKSTDADNVTAPLEANSQINRPNSGDAIVSSKLASLDAAVQQRSTNRNLNVFSDDGGIKVPGTKLNTIGNFSKNKNTTNNEKKSSVPIAVLSEFKTDIKNTCDSWDEIMKSSGSLSDSPQVEFKPWVEKEPNKEEIYGKGNDLSLKDEDIENDSQPIRSNCRTYCRSNKGKQSPGSAGMSSVDKLVDGPAKSSQTDLVLGKESLKSDTKFSSGTPGKTSTSRTARDTITLPSSYLSPCNVTLQDTTDRSMDEFTTSPADLGEAGRFRPTMSKSKKDAKLEFFGFDEQDEQEGIEGSFGANYKIKYFGFDDLSESSDEDEDSHSEGKPKKKAGNRTGETQSVFSSSESTEESQGSQTLSQSSSSPTKAVYNARHWNQPEPEELPPAPPLSHTAPGSTDQKDEGVFKAPPPPPRVIKTVTIPTQPYQDIVTALKCRKEDKELYTVVQHVKHFNDVVEFGENQEFTDDIEYLLSGLKSTQPLNTRCLSIISLATKCAMPSFRMHLRAHGMVAMVFKTLDDAQRIQNLALCTAALMYILSRDRLNMDLDRASLDLMIRLLEMEQDPCSRQLNEKEMNKIKEKIRKLCETVHNRHLDLENITIGHLAMETLLSLTSKRSGDWFKEELRLLGGLDHVVDKVKECVEQLDRHEEDDKLVASLWGAERCLRVLESVTVHNPENQGYLIAYKDSQLIISSARALRHCEQLITRYNRADTFCKTNSNCLPKITASNHIGKAVEDCMRAIFGVLLNLTNDNEWGSTKTGEQDSLISTTMNCVLQVPQYIPQEQRFDIRVLGLGLLINLVEHSARNRHCLVDMETPGSFDSFCAADGDDSLQVEGQVGAIQALVQLFLQRERAARLAETETDDFIKDTPVPPQDQSGQWQETAGSLEWVQSENITKTEGENEKKEEEDEEIDLNKALQHAGKHMEDCIVASYTALLLGCLCQESPLNVTTVREHLPEGDFSIMTEMLKKFLSFMNLTCAVGTTGQKSISRVIEYLDHC
uniref:Wings apart-like protein homolog n=1 Tax=Callorhinchus milii TaxID=7868 RepID=A0A4W3GH01_CALMI